MLKPKTLLLFFLAFTAVYQAQTPASFEGEIVYANKYSSTDPKYKAKQLTAMLGDVHTYYMKGADYKTLTNGAFAQWQLYISKDNKIYNKMIHSDTVFYNDAAQHDDEVLSTKINKKAAVILGYECDELIMVCRSGTHKYYYSSKFPVDARLFVNHKFGNLYNYLSRINAVPLKMIEEDGGVTMEMVATKIEPKKLPASLFMLPPGTKTAKSVY